MSLRSIGPRIRPGLEGSAVPADCMGGTWTAQGGGLHRPEEVSMGIRDRIKRRLPIIGMGGNRGRPDAAPPAPPAPGPAPTVSAEAAEPEADPRGGRTAQEIR